MAVSAEFSQYIEDLFTSFGTVRVRRMFGGAGVFADDLMIGLIADGTIYLRADESTVSGFVEEGSEPFGYQGKGKRIDLPYWRLPERLIEDCEEFAVWARRAQAAARRAKSKKKSGR